MNVLFLCTGNSCRSILGEATFNHLAPPGWRAMSAGSKPTGQVHPRSLALLAREGISTAGYYSKSWDNLPATPDIVISVCGNAAAETCPAYLGPVLRTHWGVEDPAHASGSDEEIDAAFMTAYRILRARIEAFFALPLEALQHDPVRLKAEMDRIGALLPDRKAAAPLVLSEQIRELIALGAAIGASCEPCFKFHYDKGRKLGLSVETMAEAVKIGEAVKQSSAQNILGLAERLLGVAVERPAASARCEEATAPSTTKGCGCH